MDISATARFITTKISYFKLLKDNNGRIEFDDEKLLNFPFNRNGFIYNSYMIKSNVFDLNDFIKHLGILFSNLSQWSSTDIFICAEKNRKKLKEDYKKLFENSTEDELAELREKLMKWVDKNKDKFSEVIKYFDIYNDIKDEKCVFRFLKNYNFESQKFDLGELPSDVDIKDRYSEYLDILYTYQKDKTIEELKKGSTLKFIGEKILSADHNSDGSKNSEIANWLKENHGVTNLESFPKHSAVHSGNFTEYYYYGIILELGDLRLATIKCYTRYNNFGGWS